MNSQPQTKPYPTGNAIGGVIERWGLRDGYDPQQVPADAEQFAGDMLNENFQAAMEIAEIFGWNPVCEPLPNVTLDSEGRAVDNVWSFILTVDGGTVPLMVKLCQTDPCDYA